jgi:hypothetical protein
VGATADLDGLEKNKLFADFSIPNPDSPVVQPAVSALYRSECTYSAYLLSCVCTVSVLFDNFASRFLANI